MKIKILAIAVTGILLSGCGNDDNGSFPTLAVQAYDPAIQDMSASILCEDGATETQKTGFDGNANFTILTAISQPETCEFTFIGGDNAVDVSNGKSMKGVTYIIPKGLASLNSAAITATPISTLIAKKLGDVAYTPAAASKVMEELGLDVILGAQNIDVTEFLLNTAAVMKKLEANPNTATEFSKFSAMTTVLTDVLKTNSSATITPIQVSAIAKASISLTANVLASNPKYPASGADGKGAPIYVSYNANTLKAYVEDTIAAVTANPDADAPLAIEPVTKVAKKVVEHKKATGATGATGDVSA